MREAAARIWASLDQEDRLEAFAAHPRDRRARRGPGDAPGRATSSPRARRSAAEVLKALEKANSDYEQRFGHVFLISATGLDADEILGALQSRLDNDPETELDVAAAEQAKIIDLRLTKLVTP